MREEPPLDIHHNLLCSHHQISIRDKVEQKKDRAQQDLNCLGFRLEIAKLVLC
jgi:hypothetical protein